MEFMDIERGYDFANKQIPGEKIVMGPTECYKTKIDPITNYPMETFNMRRIKQLSGFKPHLFAIFDGISYENATGEMLTKEDWKFLQGSSKIEIDAFMDMKFKEIVDYKISHRQG